MAERCLGHLSGHQVGSSSKLFSPVSVDWFLPHNLTYAAQVANEIRVKDSTQVPVTNCLVVES